MARPLTRAIWTRLRRRKPGELDSAAPSSVDADPLLEAGLLLRQARESRGLGLRQLAAETLISTAVLEALERGWRDRLPEAAYLRSMLPLLERYLALEPGCLRDALADGAVGPERAAVKGRRLPLLSVQLFTTWQGTAAYGALMLLLVYGLNLEQRRLAAQGFAALNPVPPLPDAVARSQAPAGSELLLQAYPELRPLVLARRGTGLALLRTQGLHDQQMAEPGVLELILARPSRLALDDGRGVRSDLQAGPGTLTLPLTPPLQLSLDPAAAAGAQVRWNGEPLKAQQPGRYSWPPRPAAAASSP